MRLHPRPAQRLPAEASKEGGTFLWPEQEPWPRCIEPELPPFEVDRGHFVPGGLRGLPVEHPAHNDFLVPVLQ